MKHISAVNGTSINGASGPRKASSGSRAARGNRFESKRLIPRAVLLGIFLGLSVLTLWLLLTDSPEAAIFTTAMALVSLACDTLRTLSKAEMKEVARAAYLPPARFETWKLRRRGAATQAVEYISGQTAATQPAKSYVEAQKHWRKSEQRDRRNGLELVGA